MVPKRRAAEVRWWWIRWPQGEDEGWSRADGPFPAKTLADFMKILEAVVPGEDLSKAQCRDSFNRTWRSLGESVKR
jgi:hypothetical protein